MEDSTLVTFSYTPLTLEELEVALTIDPSEDFFDADDVEEIPNEFIEDHLGSLLRIYPSSGIVGYVHASARQFLVSPEAGIADDAFRAEAGTFDPNLALVDMAKTCLTYLCFSEHNLEDGGERRHSEVLRKHSSIGWTLYLDELSDNVGLSDDVRPVLDHFFQDVGRVTEWLRTVYEPSRDHYETGVIRSKSIIERVVSARISGPQDDLQRLLYERCKPFIDQLGFSDKESFPRWGVFMFVQWCRRCIPLPPLCRDLLTLL